MRDITPLHLQPDAIPEPWKRKPLREPVFRHPLAIAGFKAYPSVKAFGKDIRNVIHECYRLAMQATTRDGDLIAATDYRAAAREYEAWAREEGLI